ncbi:enolase C-terminal domain-like protein [Niveispirillum fermenti]|uniref:enolase C-terminal domain-like protein n=1 Tax=Niveispirillum fermenti TaxID=1233113 RepID=UPI003A8BB31F
MIRETACTAAMARIVAAELFEIEVAFSRPYNLSKSYGTLAGTRAVLLKLTDADGLVGWGEANPMQPFTAESPREAGNVLHDLLLPAILREARPEPGRIEAILDNLQAGHLCAKGAVSMALLDLLGRRLRVPVATLLGGAVHACLPVLWPLGAGTADDDMAIIDDKLAQGFHTFMLKMGVAPVREEIHRVATLEARYGHRVKLIADANQGWTRDEALEFLTGVAGSSLTFVEQPVAKDDLEGLAMVARASTLPISADEALTGLTEAARLAALGAANVFSIKSSKNGGPLRAQRIATIAEAFGIRCYMNSMLEFGITQAASLHHAVTMTNLVDAGHAFMSTLRLAEDPTDFAAFVRNGVVHLPDRPGLGVEVDEAHVRHLALSIRQVR